MASASGNLWTFAPGVQLDPSTTYYFYNTTASDDAYDVSGDAGVFAPGGEPFEAADLTVDYNLSGQVAAVPEPSSISLLLTLIAALGLVVGRKSRVETVLP